MHKYDNIINGVYKPIPEHYGKEMNEMIKNMLTIDPVKRIEGQSILEQVKAILEN